MTAPSNLRRARLSGSEAANPSFCDRAGCPAERRIWHAAKSADIYHITATLPPRGNSPQYRIRNDEERHERVTTQDDLEPVAISQPSDSATLIERTFGNG